MSTATHPVVLEMVREGLAVEAAHHAALPAIRGLGIVALLHRERGMTAVAYSDGTLHVGRVVIPHTFRAACDHAGLFRKMAFAIGQRVRVKGGAFTTARDGRVGHYQTAHSGMQLYVLEDGGMFGANELEAR